jgi:hypothetical protein
VRNDSERVVETLEIYTFLTLGCTMQRTHVYAGIKEMFVPGFSNSPENTTHRSGMAVTRRSNPVGDANDTVGLKDVVNQLN